MRAFSKACSVAWAILPDSLRMLLEIASRDHLPNWEAVEGQRSKRHDSAERIRMRGGVAVINVTGPIFRYADFFTEISGATSVAALARDFNVAMNDPGVSSILLNVDSPGGEIAGINEFAGQVFDGRKRSLLDLERGR